VSGESEVSKLSLPELTPVSPSKYRSKKKHVLSSRYEQEMRQRFEAKVADELRQTETEAVKNLHVK